MKLAVFDFDGTLGLTIEADTRCYVKAVCKALGLSGIDIDWSHYRYTTDSGILIELYENALGRAPSEHELTKVRLECERLLRDAKLESPTCMKEVPGAVEAFRKLSAHPEWRVAVATGTWASSAKVKMAGIGLDVTDIPVVTASDHLERHEIIEAAVRKSCQKNGVQTFERVVYVGGGVWDFEAARKLSIAFLGVDSHGNGSRLLKAGAKTLIPNYLEWEGVLMALETCQILMPVGADSRSE